MKTIITATIVALGALGAYCFYTRKTSVHQGRKLGLKNVDIKECDIITMSEIGPWLLKNDVDLDDFGKSRKLFLWKDLSVDVLPKISNDLRQKICSANKAIAVVLTDMDCNTISTLVLVGNGIEEKLSNQMKQTVTEVRLK